jgi:hypothetical protein
MPVFIRFCDFLVRLIPVFFWITLGAALLLAAQVLIPNARRCLNMEVRCRELQNRVLGLSSRLESRIHAGAMREINEIRSSLGLSGTGTHEKGFAHRIGLCANSNAVVNLLQLVASSEARLSLMEQLDELVTSEPHLDRMLPITVRWARHSQLRSVSSILKRKLILDSDYKLAKTFLDKASLLDNLVQSLTMELEMRATRIIKEFAKESWKSKVAPYLDLIPSLKNVLQTDLPRRDVTGWGEEGLFQLDLTVLRLSMIHRVIEVSGNQGDSDLLTRFRELIQSTDANRLAEALSIVDQIAENVRPADIETALTKGPWDIWYSPDVVTDQDALNARIVFREARLDRATAKRSFVCWWNVQHVDSASLLANKSLSQEEDGAGEVFEFGWEVQLTPSPGRLTLTPSFYSPTGSEIMIPTLEPHSTTPAPPTDSQNPVPTPNATQSPSPISLDSARTTVSRRSAEITVSKRLMKSTLSKIRTGSMEALLTALVPVVTVAVTQAQNMGGTYTWQTLVLLGFTSQAIRGALVPSGDAKPTA